MKKFITVFLIVIASFTLSSCSNVTVNTGPNELSKAKAGLKYAKKGDFKAAFFSANQAKQNLLEGKKEEPKKFERLKLDETLTEVENILAQIEEMKKAAAEKKKKDREEKERKDDFFTPEDAVDGNYEEANDLLDIGGTGGSNKDLDDLNNNPVQMPVPVPVPVQDYGGSGYSGSGD